MFQECKDKTEKYAVDASHISAGDSMEEALSHLQKFKKIARKLQNGSESGVLKSRGRKQKLSSFQVSVKKSENLKRI